jgi:GNAT superfamily N-acetyltransferase
MKRLFYFLYALSLPLFADQIVHDRNGREIRIAIVKSEGEIDLDKAKEIIVRSFMTAYEDIPLLDLNPNFRSTGDVRRFYERYFDTELSRYRAENFYWVQAFAEDKLVGWATFESEPNEALYMDLLIVDPDEQGKGIGKYLVFSILEECPQVHSINILIRKLNAEGEKFYRQIGFTDVDYTRDNFVDPSLLTGLRWNK